MEDISFREDIIFSSFKFKFKYALLILAFRTFSKLLKEYSSAFASASLALYEFLFWFPLKIFHEKFKLNEFVYADPFSLESIEVDK